MCMKGAESLAFLLFMYLLEGQNHKGGHLGEWQQGRK